MAMNEWKTGGAAPREASRPRRVGEPAEVPADLSGRWCATGADGDMVQAIRARFYFFLNVASV